MPSAEMTTTLADVQAWAMIRGPELRRKINALSLNALTVHEKREFEAVKAICPCHFTNHPRELSSNGEDCDTCGRKM